MNKARHVYQSEIDFAYRGCPYCFRRVQEDPHPGCCGEVHAETVYVIAGEFVLADHVKVVADPPGAA